MSPIWLLAATSLIARWEGFSPVTYRDVGDGSERIGYGTVPRGVDTIDHTTAWRDMEDKALLVGEFIRVRCEGRCESAAHMAALVSFTYNVGVGNLLSSTLWKYHLAGEHDKAQQEFGRWVYADGKVLLGLKLRREAEAEVYSIGNTTLNKRKTNTAGYGEASGATETEGGPTKKD